MGMGNFMKVRSLYRYICPTSIDMKPIEGEKYGYEKERFIITIHRWILTNYYMKETMTLSPTISHAVRNFVGII
jgi:hypothetical protein